MYFMLILVSGAKMQSDRLYRQTDRQTYSTTTVTLCTCALRVNYGIEVRTTEGMVVGGGGGGGGGGEHAALLY